LRVSAKFDEEKTNVLPKLFLDEISNLVFGMLDSKGKSIQSF